MVRELNFVAITRSADFADRPTCLDLNSGQAARTAVPRRAGRRNPLRVRGTPNLNFRIRCFRIHSSFARLYPSLPRRLEVLIYAQIYVLRALDGEIFFASGGAARRGAREGLSSMSARRLHLFENFTRRSPQADNNKSI